MNCDVTRTTTEAVSNGADSTIHEILDILTEHRAIGGTDACVKRKAQAKTVNTLTQTRDGHLPVFAGAGLCTGATAALERPNNAGPLPAKKDRPGVYYCEFLLDGLALLVREF